DFAMRELAQAHPDWTRITPAGDFRRGCELVRDLVLVAMDADHRGEVTTHQQGDITLYVGAPDQYGAALLLATGSSAHLAALRKLANARGLTLDTLGLRQDGAAVPAETEAEVYQALGLPFIPPELRETGEEAALAAE